MNLKHTFNTDVDTFWSKVFFDEAYNRRLYLEALGFRGFEVLELTKHPDGSVTRRVKTTPKEDAPAAVKKLIGAELAYTETGRFDPTTKKWKYEIVPSQMANKVSIKGEYWLDPAADGPDGQKRVLRTCTVDLEVKVPFIGSIVEAFIEGQTKTSYELAEKFTNSYIAEQKL